MKKLNAVQKKWIYRALIMLIFILAFSLRVHHLNQKDGLHVDEIYSFILADYKDVGWSSPIPEGEYTGEQLKNIIYSTDIDNHSKIGLLGMLDIIVSRLNLSPPLRDSIFDVVSLWKTNRDSPHTNFYYTLLRISMVGMDCDDYTEFRDAYFFRASVLNLIIFTFSFMALLVLLNLLMKDKTLILLGLAVSLFNPISVSDGLFFRPYGLQFLFSTIFLAFIVWLSKKIKNDEFENTSQNLFLFALPLSLMLLTGYYSFVFAFVIGVFFVGLIIIPNKKMNLIPFFFLGSILAVLLDILFYNDFLAGFYSSRAAGSLTIDTNFITFMLNALFTGLFYNLSLLFLAIAVIYKIIKKESFSLSKEYVLIISSAFVTILIIGFIAPFATERYISSFVFCIALLYPALLQSMKNVYLKRFLCLAIATVFLFVSTKNENIKNKHSYYGGTLSAEFLNANIDKDDPICISVFSAAMSCIIDELDDEQMFCICNTDEALIDKFYAKKNLIIAENKSHIILEAEKCGYKIHSLGSDDLKIFSIY